VTFNITKHIDKILKEYGAFGKFDGSLTYNDWTDFKTKLKTALNTGFKDIDQLLELMDMKKDLYDRIVDIMIYHWKDSVSKSLLHGISNLRNKIPKNGDNIFPNIGDQTKFLMISGSGATSNNIFGQSNNTAGLNYIRRFDLSFVKDKKNPKEYLKVGRYNALTMVDNSKVNTILQYIWLYVFYNRYKVSNKGNINKKKIKLPSRLYRGVRGFFGNTKIPELKSRFKEIYDNKENSRYQIEALKFQALVDYIVKNGISKLSDGKYLSFTSSESIARYFSDSSGFILCVDPTKVDIITSELTEPAFGEKDYVSNKKEKEYIINIPANYRFKPEDFILTNKDSLLGQKNPLVVESLDHDNILVSYELDGHNIEAKYIWQTNSKGMIYFYVDGQWGRSRNECKKEYGFDPMPTTENLSRITNFKAYEVSSYSRQRKEIF